MRIQPITQSTSYKSKKNLRSDNMEKLEKLGAKIAVSGGIILPAGAKPETIAEFNKIMAEGQNGDLKPLRSCISSLLNIPLI